MCLCGDVFLEERLSVYLMILKIAPNLKGYYFLKEGVKKIAQDTSKKFNVGNGLYTEIAQENGIKKDLVDRAMRHAIEVSIKRNGISDFERVMSVSFKTDKPTPRELLCILAEKAILECKRMLANKDEYIQRWSAI